MRYTFDPLINDFRRASDVADNLITRKVPALHVRDYKLPRGTQSKELAVFLCTLLLTSCHRSSNEATAAPAPAQASANAETAQPAAAASGKTADLSEVANAGGWDAIAQLPDGSKYYVAPSSYRLLDDHRIAVAEKITGRASAPDPATVYIDEYDCARHSQSAIAYFRLDANGKTIGGHQYDPSERTTTALSPGMVGWTIAQSFCKALQMDS